MQARQDCEILTLISCLTPSQNSLVYRVHHCSIRDDTHEMRAEPAVQSSRAFFCYDETQRLQEPCIFDYTVDAGLPETCSEDLRGCDVTPERDGSTTGGTQGSPRGGM
jgi:hypothetical protein